MDQNLIRPSELIKAFVSKASLKQEVYFKTLQIFRQFKTESEKFISLNSATVGKSKFPLLFEYKDRGDFQFELRFGSDILIFMMHTNIFEFPRDHEVMKTQYIRQDKLRSYCGNIMIFNFLSDSFKYTRSNDLGYLIGRLFVNREQHYFLEGKREVGMLYNNFARTRLNLKTIRSIIYSSILYTINFDLLTPPFENFKEVTQQEMQSQLDSMSIRTGKRIGFRFQADEVVQNGK
ncbi:MAG: hypothetical protein NTU51_05680 [Bacteroidetes bacterium]|nr:hypothetical protein [Bacteroidota bacterium]